MARLAYPLTVLTNISSQARHSPDPDRTPLLGTQAIFGVVRTNGRIRGNDVNIGVKFQVETKNNVAFVSAIETLNEARDLILASGTGRGRGSNQASAGEGHWLSLFARLPEPTEARTYGG